MTNSRRALTGGIAVAAVLTSSIALAATVRKQDPNDVSGRLDIRTTSAQRADEGSRFVRHRIETYAAWKSTVLSTSSPLQAVCVYVWRGASKPSRARSQDYNMCAAFKDGKLSGRISETSTGKSRSVPVRRANRNKGIVFELPAKALGLDQYFWQAATRDGGDERFWDMAPERPAAAPNA